MSVKFDAAAAESLIGQMDGFCSAIQREAVDILDILELSGEWDDPQLRRFHETIQEINKDLMTALRLQDSYMRLFAERVEELRG